MFAEWILYGRSTCLSTDRYTHTHTHVIRQINLKPEGGKMEGFSTTFCRFLRLRSFVHQMKKGGYLFVEEETGLHLYWFALDATLGSIHWSDPRDQDTMESVSLGDVDQVSYGIYPRPLCRNGRSPTLTLHMHDEKGTKIQIVAPNWKEFEIWYQGLVFLTGSGKDVSKKTIQEMRTNAPVPAQPVQMTPQRVPQFPKPDQLYPVNSPVRPKKQDLPIPPNPLAQHQSPSVPEYDESFYEEDEQDRGKDYECGESEYTDGADDVLSDSVGNRLHELEKMITEQERCIQSLHHQKQSLEELRRQKDQTIRKLLQDLHEVTPNHQRTGTPAYYSRESDMNHRTRTTPK